MYTIEKRIWACQYVMSFPVNVVVHVVCFEDKKKSLQFMSKSQTL